MTSNAEGVHRHANRFRAGVPVILESGGVTIECEAENISKTGVLLLGSLPHPASEILDFTISAPTGTLKVALSGRVVRVEPEGEGCLRVALEFVGIDDARQAGLDALISRLLQVAAVGQFDQLKPGSPPQEIKKALEAIPLPQRIALSARASPKEREILRQDTHSAVLEALAHNPGLTVAEARLLSTSTHLTPGALDVLANDLRFKEDEELRMNVASHPRVKLATAERVTAGFKSPQLKKLLARPGLGQVLREKLLRRSTER